MESQKSKKYIPEPGDILTKIGYYHNNFPRKIEILKITRSGHVHYKDLTRSGNHTQSVSLHVLRKCFTLNQDSRETKSE